MSVSRSLLVLSVAALALAACSEIREDLGLGRSPPDEFAVVERPPLSLPPDFNLRPPRPGAPRPQDVNMQQRASETLFSGNAPATAIGESAGEKALLAAAGASKAEPDIRDKVERDAAQKVSASPHLVERLLDGKNDKDAVTVDAAAEAERIKQSKEKGEPVNQTATPIIEKQSSGWLGL